VAPLPTNEMTKEKKQKKRIKRSAGLSLLSYRPPSGRQLSYYPSGVDQKEATPLPSTIFASFVPLVRWSNPSPSPHCFSGPQPHGARWPPCLGPLPSPFPSRRPEALRTSSASASGGGGGDTTLAAFGFLGVSGGEAGSRLRLEPPSGAGVAVLGAGVAVLGAGVAALVA